MVGVGVFAVVGDGRGGLRGGKCRYQILLGVSEDYCSPTFIICILHLFNELMMIIFLSELLDSNRCSTCCLQS